MTTDVLEIPCAACGELTRIAGDELPATGEIPCVHCGEPISFRAAPAGPAAAPRSTGQWPPGPLTFAPAPVGVRRGALARAETGEPRPSAVTCPACGHRFAPGPGGPVRPTVLVVEDTEFFQELAARSLGGRYTVVAARTAAEARAVLRTHPVDLVVLDLTLPDAEGAGVLRAVPSRGLPVLVYTSRDETQMIGEEWNALRALGAQDIVYKGINIEDALLRKVDALFAREPVSAG